MKFSEEEVYFFREILTHRYFIRNFKEFQYLDEIGSGKSTQCYSTTVFLYEYKKVKFAVKCMKINTLNFRKQHILEDIINDNILKEIEVLSNLSEKITSSNIAKMYGISCEIKNSMLIVNIIMEKFDLNLWQYILKY